MIPFLDETLIAIIQFFKTRKLCSKTCCQNFTLKQLENPNCSFKIKFHFSFSSTLHHARRRCLIGSSPIYQQEIRCQRSICKATEATNRSFEAGQREETESTESTQALYH